MSLSKIYNDLHAEGFRPKLVWSNNELHCSVVTEAGEELASITYRRTADDPIANARYSVVLAGLMSSCVEVMAHTEKDVRALMNRRVLNTVGQAESLMRQKDAEHIND